MNQKLCVPCSIKAKKRVDPSTFVAGTCSACGQARIVGEAK